MEKKAIYLRSCLVVLVCLLGSLQVLAQPRAPQRQLDLGVYGGSVLSSMDFKPTVNQDKALGYTFGAVVRYYEEMYCGVQAEFAITRRGYRDRYSDMTDLHFQRNLTYAELPLMASFYIPMGKRNEINIVAGPKLGLLLWESTDSNLPDTFGSDASTANIETRHHSMDVSKRFDYGIQAGLGYEFKFNRHYSVLLSGRYYFGLGNIFPDTKSDVFEVSSNQQIQITLTLFWHRYFKQKYK